MITWLKSLFKKEERSAPKIISKPELMFANAIRGQMCILSPKEDITPYEAAQLTNLIGYLTLNRYTISNTRLDVEKFIEDNNLQRHFSPISSEN